MKKQTNSLKPARKINIKTIWDFSKLYKSVKDPQIDADTATLEKVYADFAAKYAHNQAYLENDAKLLKAVQDYEKLIENVGGMKPHFYLLHNKDIDTANSEISAKLTKITERLIKAGNQTLFFELSLSKLPKEKLEKIIKDPAFAKYSRFFEKILIKSKYMLSESEEKILSLKHETSYKMWVDAQQKLATSKTIKYKGKDMPIQEALILRRTLPQKERYKVHDLCMEVLKDISFMAEAEFNAIVNDKKIEDELRGMKVPYESTVIDYENDIKTVENLIETVSKNSKIVHDFYKVKAQVMGLKKLRMPDLLITLSKKKKKVSFEDAVQMVHEALVKTDQKLGDFLVEMVEDGRIDVYPRKGKRSGGYCTSPSKNLPIYIFLNFDNTIDGAMTLAHEMGHALHSKLSIENQSEINFNYPISVAEVASTFFEHILFDHLFETMTEEEKAISLLNKIEGDIGTIFRQTQFFNFEKDLHKNIRDKGTISKEEMAALYRKHAQAMNGPVVDIKETDGYTFTHIPHFRYFFYVYSYAYGQIISKALFAKYKQDPKFIEKVKQFLSSGGSKSPYETFRSIGIDTSKPEFFEEGIRQIREELNTAVKLAKKVGLIKRAK